MLYHHHENFILPLSHDEVVHGKGSLLARMPGDDWRRFANLRTLLGYQWCFPGPKCSRSWAVNSAKAPSGMRTGNWTGGCWRRVPPHLGTQRFVQDLNKLYAAEPALWQSDYDLSGFYWIDASDHDNSVLSFIRQDASFRNQIAVVLNLTPVTRFRYRVGLPRPGRWREIMNSDAKIYGGSNVGNLGGVVAAQHKCHNQQYSAEMTLPPLSIIAFKAEAAG